MKPFIPVNDVADAKAARKQRAAFFTPLPLVEKLVEWSDMLPSMRILEPSAGDGRIVHALFAVGAKAVDACEIDGPMRERLDGMGACVVADDFLTHQPGAVYDLIVMNPPFKGRTAEKHIGHAWSLLAPGGRLVSIAPPTVGDRMDEGKLNLPGCEYAVHEDLGADWFLDYGTNIRVIVATLERNHPADIRECEGYSNHSTFNAAVTIGSDSEMAERARSLVTADAWRDAFAVAIGKSGGSVYGIDWAEVSRDFQQRWADDAREEAEIKAAAEARARADDGPRDQFARDVGTLNALTLDPHDLVILPTRMPCRPRPALDVEPLRLRGKQTEQVQVASVAQHPLYEPQVGVSRGAVSAGEQGLLEPVEVARHLAGGCADVEALGGGEGRGHGESVRDGADVLRTTDGSAVRK